MPSAGSCPGDASASAGRHREEPGHALLSRQRPRSADPSLRRRPKSTSIGCSARTPQGASTGGRDIKPEADAPVRQNIRPHQRELRARAARLHTLGVDGGYTQQDIVNLARALTGWTLGRPRSAEAASFWFNPRMHEHGGQGRSWAKNQGGGIEDGERALDLLARHPSTARFIATKLARLFVSMSRRVRGDRAASTFRTTDGDLRESCGSS